MSWATISKVDDNSLKKSKKIAHRSLSSNIKPREKWFQKKYLQDFIHHPGLDSLNDKYSQHIISVNYIIKNYVDRQCVPIYQFGNEKNLKEYLYDLNPEIVEDFLLKKEEYYRKLYGSSQLAENFSETTTKKIYKNFDDNSEEDDDDYDE